MGISKIEILKTQKQDNKQKQIFKVGPSQIKKIGIQMAKSQISTSIRSDRGN